MVISAAAWLRGFKLGESAVAGGLGPTELLHFGKLFRILGREVAHFGKVFFDVIEFPAVGIEVPTWLVDGDGVLTVVPDGATAPKFEILRVTGMGALRIVKGRADAFTMQRHLADAVEYGGRGDAGDIEDGRGDIDNVYELTA